jgi:hypothetical protein
MGVLIIIVAAAAAVGVAGGAVVGSQSRPALTQQSQQSAYQAPTNCNPANTTCY